MSQKRRRLKLSFESDWHIGTGAGIPGSVDRQVLRDGLPLRDHQPGGAVIGDLRQDVPLLTSGEGERLGGVQFIRLLPGQGGDQVSGSPGCLPPRFAAGGQQNRKKAAEDSATYVGQILRR